MKKLLLYSLSLFAVSMGMFSCSDEEKAFSPDDTERKFMTMFRCDNNTGKGDSDPS